MPETDVRMKVQIAPRYLLIFLLPVGVLIVSEYILGTFGDITLVVPGTQIETSAQLVELSARYKFLAALFFYGAVALTLTAVFASELHTRHTWRSKIYTLIGILGMIVVSMLFSTIEPDWMPGSFESYQLLGEDLFRSALGIGNLPGCSEGSHLENSCDGQGAFFAMRFLLERVNFLTSLAAAAVIAGMVLALSKPRERTDLLTSEGLLREARALQAAHATVQRYLYCSGILLTTGMILVLAWMTWPSAMIQEAEIRAAHSNMVSSISLFRGVTYSVLILSYYMPVSLVLKVRIDRFKAASLRAENSDILPQIEGFDITRIASLDALKAILAIVSPILTSAIGSFADLSAFIG